MLVFKGSPRKIPVVQELQGIIGRLKIYGDVAPQKPPRHPKVPAERTTVAKPALKFFNSACTLELAAKKSDSRSPIWKFLRNDLNFR